MQPREPCHPERSAPGAPRQLGSTTQAVGRSKGSAVAFPNLLRPNEWKGQIDAVRVRVYTQNQQKSAGWRVSNEPPHDLRSPFVPELRSLLPIGGDFAWKPANSQQCTYGSVAVRFHQWPAGTDCGKTHFQGLRFPRLEHDPEPGERADRFRPSSQRARYRFENTLRVPRTQ